MVNNLHFLQSIFFFFEYSDYFCKKMVIFVFQSKVEEMT